MPLAHFDRILESLVQFEALRVDLRLQVQHIQSEHEALLKQLSKYGRTGHSHHIGLFAEASARPSVRTCELGFLQSEIGTEQRELALFSGPRAASRSVSQPRSLYEPPFQLQQPLPHPKTYDLRDFEADVAAVSYPKPDDDLALEADNTPPAAMTPRIITPGDTGSNHAPSIPDGQSPHGSGSHRFAIVLWPLWNDGSATKSLHSTNIKPLTTTSIQTQSPRAGDEIGGHTCMDSIVIKPSSRVRMCWDVLSMIVLGHDIVVIPLQPFDLPESYFMRLLDVLTIVFWSLDVCASCTTGFQQTGVLEMRFEKVVKHYLRSWFPMDFLLLFVDYFLLVAPASEGLEFLSFIRIGKALRIVRISRMLRLLRLLKATNLLGGMADWIFSETTFTVFGVMKLIVLIVIVNHLLACGWYAVGAQDIDADVNTWVKRLKAIDNSEDSFAWLYTSAIHWSITQFTPASMEIFPCNVAERCYALCVILFALVAFSSFVSSITTSMTHLRLINSEQARQRNLVRMYITQNKLSMSLGNRVQTFFREHRSASNRVKRVHESDIEAFGSLPYNLRQELRGQVYMPILVQHPVFYQIRRHDKEGLVSVCHSAIDEARLLCGEELFTTGDTCKKMFFVFGGQLEYYLSYGSMPAIQLGKRDYICEMVLWVLWEHHGRLIANTTCDIICLDSQKFRVVARQAASLECCQKYAHDYVGYLHAQQQHLSDLLYVNTQLAQEAFSDYGVHEEPTHIDGVFLRFRRGVARTLTSISAGTGVTPKSAPRMDVFGRN